MASTIRSTGALRRRLPLLLRSGAGPLRRALEEERRCLARPLIGNPRLFSSGSGGRASSHKHPCKFNLEQKKHLEGQLAYLKMAAEKDASDWRAMRETLEASVLRQVELDEQCEQQDKVVNRAAAVLFVALLAGSVLFR